MRYLKDYEIFTDLIFEAVNNKLCLYYSDDFRNILQIIRRSTESDKVSELLLYVEGDESHLSKFTLIDTTDKNDTISFVQSNRILNDDDTNNYTRNDGTIERHLTKTKDNTKYWKESRTEMVIGRWSRKVVVDVMGKTITQKDIEDFTNRYKATYDSIGDEDGFELVSGEDIRKYYLVDNYESKYGQLGNSCMRYPYNQDYFDIYVKNPEVCKLLILKSDTPGKIKGRALIWKLTTGKYYQDRVYTTNDSDVILFRKWAKDKDMNYYSNFYRKDIVQLGDYEYEKFPYMDTFCTYNFVDKVLETTDDKIATKGFYYLKDTGGNFISDTAVWSDYADDWISRDRAVLCIDDEWVPEDAAIYLEYNDTWYSDESPRLVYSRYHERYLDVGDSVYSSELGEYLHADDDNIIEVISKKDKLSQENMSWTHVPKERTDLYVEHEGKLYSASIMVKDIFSGGYQFINNLSTDFIEKIGVYTKEDAISELSEICKNEEYGKEVIEFISNNKIFIERIRKVYFGIHKRFTPVVKDIIEILLASTISPVGSRDFIHALSEINSDISDKYSKWPVLLTYQIREMVKNFDYSMLGDDAYKIWVYFNVID